jgi:hypothetical protein
MRQSARVIYLHVIKKVAGYAHVMEKFSDNCMPCTQNSLTCMYINDSECDAPATRIRDSRGTRWGRVARR